MIKLQFFIDQTAFDLQTKINELQNRPNVQIISAKLGSAYDHNWSKLYFTVLIKYKTIVINDSAK